MQLQLDIHERFNSQPSEGCDEKEFSENALNGNVNNLRSALVKYKHFNIFSIFAEIGY